MNTNTESFDDLPGDADGSLTKKHFAYVPRAGEEVLSANDYSKHLLFGSECMKGPFSANDRLEDLVARWPVAEDLADEQLPIATRARERNSITSLLKRLFAAFKA